MRLEHEFTVPVPVEEAWQVLLDLPRVAPCMPGATLTGVDGDNFTGTVKVKLGPISLTYQGKGHFVERDDAAHRVVIEASGKDARSAGTAAATVTASLAGSGDATTVEVTTDLTVTGRPAQFGRGMIADVSAKLIGQFADCLARTLSAGTPEPSGAAPATTAAAAPDRRGGAAVTEPGTVTAPPAYRPEPVEPEPIDLLRITGGTPAARRFAAYGVGAILLAAVAVLVIRRFRRAHAG